MKNVPISQREEPFGCAIILSLHRTKTTWSFVDYVKSFNLPNPRMGIVNLFKALDTKIRDRDKYDLSLMPFPYENGMPPELRKAHRENDKSVMAAYGFKKDIPEAEVVGEMKGFCESLPCNSNRVHCRVGSFLSTIFPVAQTTTKKRTSNSQKKNPKIKTHSHRKISEGIGGGSSSSSVTP